MPVLQGFVQQNAAMLGANWRLQFTDMSGVLMNMQSFEAIDFGAISYKEIFQNVKTILATPLESAALERTLGVDQSIVDRPLNNAAEVVVATLDAVNRWEPRCSVANIDFQPDLINGHLTVLLQLNINSVIYGTATPYPAKDILPIPKQEPPVTIRVPGPPGPPGPQGQRGTLWFTGDVTPDLYTPTVPLQTFDLYLHLPTGDVYQYTAVGDTFAARWSKIKGAKQNGVG